MNRLYNNVIHDNHKYTGFHMNRLYNNVIHEKNQILTGKFILNISLFNNDIKSTLLLFVFLISASTKREHSKFHLYWKKGTNLIRYTKFSIAYVSQLKHIAKIKNKT